MAIGEPDVNDIDPIYWLAAATVAVGLIDRGWSIAERFVRRARGLRSADLNRAREMVRGEEEREALRALAEKHQQIIAQLTPNGGTSLRDAVDNLAQMLGRHLIEAQADRVAFAQHAADTSAHPNAVSAVPTEGL